MGTTVRPIRRLRKKASEITSATGGGARGGIGVDGAVIAVIGAIALARGVAAMWSRTTRSPAGNAPHAGTAATGQSLPSTGDADHAPVRAPRPIPASASSPAVYLAQAAPRTFGGVYYAIVAALGLVALAGVVGLVWQPLVGATVPSGLVALSTAAVGAIGGLLVDSPTTGKGQGPPSDRGGGADDAGGATAPSNRPIYTVIVVLGLVALIGVVGLILIELARYALSSGQLAALANAKGSLGRIDIPEGIVAIATAAVGAVAGLLAPSPSQHAEAINRRNADGSSSALVRLV